MKLETILVTVMIGFGGAPAIGQNPAPAKPASAKPAAAARPSAAKSPSQVDDVIKLVKGGMSEAFIIKSLQKNDKPINLGPADLVKLKEAGVSENIMSVMMDPKSASTSVTAPVPAPTPAASTPPPVVAMSPKTPPAPDIVAPATPATPASPSPAAVAQKKRVIVDAFDYSAVMSSVQAVFGIQQNIGTGIRAMLTSRLTQQGNVVIVERAKIDLLQKEQDRNTGNRVKQGSGARVGGISGADALLAGDIIIFGRDDKKKSAGAAAVAGWCRLCGAIGAAKKEEKAVVAINYRFIDAETSEVIASGEARGESVRKSTNWAAIGGAFGNGAGAVQVDMTSSNFAETIIGEATQDCVNKLAVILNTQAAAMKKTIRTVEAFVADVAGNTIVISAGSSDGVNAGEVFEIFRIEREVKDPVTKEILDRITTKVGELTVASVRDKIATGSYAGTPAAVGFVARKKL